LLQRLGKANSEQKTKTLDKMQLYTVQLQCTDRIAKVVQMRVLPTLHVRQVHMIIHYTA